MAADLDYRAIGKRIRCARNKINITQEVLAEKANLSIPHVSNIETGKTKLSLPAIITIANTLNVSVDELLCDNVIKSKTVFDDEIQRLVSDCDDYEIRILVDIFKAAKTAIRKDDNLRTRQ